MLPLVPRYPLQDRSYYFSHCSDSFRRELRQVFSFSKYARGNLHLSEQSFSSTQRNSTIHCYRNLRRQQQPKRNFVGHVDFIINECSDDQQLWIGNRGRHRNHYHYCGGKRCQRVDYVDGEHSGEWHYHFVLGLHFANFDNSDCQPGVGFSYLHGDE